MRIACIYVASFPLAAWWRSEPDLRGAAAVVTDAPGARARIVAVAPEALQLGIAVGMTAAQALAIASDLVVHVASPAAEHAAQAALCDVAYSCSPRVEEGGVGTVYCDAEGLHELYASEAELARAIVARAHTLGLAASVGIAASKIAARLAAHDGGGCAVIPAHEEWHFLAPLPMHMLAPDAALQETLARWGVRTLGDLAALPASAVATRLGPGAAALARRARGEDEHPLVSRLLPLHFEEAAELEYGVDNLEPFLFVVRGLLDRLIARLAMRGLICGDLRLSLGLAGRGRDERIVAVAAPSNEIKPLLTLIRLHLEAHPPSDAVETVRLAGGARAPAPDAARSLPPQRTGAGAARRHPGAPGRERRQSGSARRSSPIASAGGVRPGRLCQDVDAGAAAVAAGGLSLARAARIAPAARPAGVLQSRPARLHPPHRPGRRCLRLHRPRRHPRRPLAIARRMVAP